MIGKNVYKIFAPRGAKWSEWIRPVPFIAIDTYSRVPINNWVDRKICFLTEYRSDVAIVIDLPGKESIEYAIAFAKIGYRPVPLFNGTDEQINSKAIIDTYIVESCLINASKKLEKINIAIDANPAFILDSYRTNRYRTNESMYDNSWDLYKQDLPSIEYFKQNNIKKIIIIGKGIQRDLKKIFYEFQRHGIEFFLTDGYKSEKKIILRKNLKERFEKEEL